MPPNEKNKNEDSIICMTCGDAPIELIHKNAVSFYETANFDKDLLNTRNTWHMIVVHHKGKVKQKEILNALFNVVGENEFFPVAYRQYDLYDKFLVRQCRAAIIKLFEKKLTLVFPMTTVPLTIKFNIADYSFGQIYPAKRVDQAVEIQFHKKETIDDVPNVLNLDKFSSHPELADIIVDLSNKSSFDLLCKIISQNHEILNNINGLKLSNNNIQTLISMNAFAKADLQMIDLRCNNIKQIPQLKPLRSINVTELNIAGNPITNIRGYIEQIKEMLPNLLKIDGVHTKKGSNSRGSSAETIEIMFEGDKINPHDTVNCKKYKGSEMWHQVIVEHKGNYTKAEIIDALFANTANQITDLYPCYYKVGRDFDYFFVRNAYEQLECLIANGLCLRIPDTEETISLSLKMNVANYKAGQVDPTDILMQAASERFNLMDRLLNLEGFNTSNSLKNLTLSLGNTRTLTSVLLQCARRYLANVVELRLGHNDIVSGKGMHPLNWLKNLKVLDLSNNRIAEISDLESIPKSTIKELRLDGNPLCKKYTFPGDYIKAVKEVFPDITKLDGIVLANEGGIGMQKNYLCSLEAYHFVDQFVSNYFATYDSRDRIKLADMYHSNAILSISMYYDHGKINSYIAPRIAKYTKMSRNLLKMSNFNRAYTSMFNGRDEIATVLKSLPPSAHDMFSFTTDTTIFTRQLICITITGMFQEEASSLLESDLLFHFTRTFILHPNATELGVFKSTTEYQIVNETFLIFNPTPWQLRNAFKYSKPADNYSIEAVTPEDKESFTIMLQQVTGLKAIWCTRCFEDGKWNFKQALEKFLDLVNKNQIPPSAFMEGHQIC